MAHTHEQVGADSFISYKNVDISKISFGPPVKSRNNAGAKMINVMYAGNPFYVQLPKMVVSTVFDSKDNTSKFSLNVSFQDIDVKDSVKEVFTLLNAMDDRVMDEAVNNGQLWFRQNVTRESLQFPHSRTIKNPTDPTLYKPSFRPTIYTKDDKVNAQVFDENRVLNPNFKLDSIRGCEVILLLHCSSVWLINGKFGLSWKVLMMRVYPRTKVQSMRVLPSDAIRAQDINMSALTFSAPRSMTAGDGKIVLVSHNNKPLIIRTPKMLCPFGCQVYPDKPDAKPYIELSFRDAEMDNDVRFFKEVMTAMDSKIKSEMEKEGWFRVPGGGAPVYNSLLSQNNPAYPAVLKASFQLEHNQITAPIVTSSGAPFGLHELDRRLKGALISAVIQCTSIWATGAKCGVSFRVLELTVVPAPSVIECKMEASDDEEDAPFFGQSQQALADPDEQPSEEAVPEIASTYVPDSDDDV